MNNIIVNGRFISAKVTGVQRYAGELYSRIEDRSTLRQPTGRGSFAGNLWEQFSLPCTLAAGDVLWSPANMGPLLAARHVVTIHDAAPLVNPGWFSPAFRIWYAFAWRELAKNAAMILTVSEFSRRELITRLRIPEAKVKVVYNGADHILNVQKLPLKEIQHISESRPFVLAVGSLQPRKNFPRLLLAWERARVRDAILVVVGEENAIFAGERLMGKSHGNIVFTGRVQDCHLAWLYANAAAYFSPSLYEGFGITPLEAMHFGCPVYVSDIPVHREVLGRAAEYFSPYSIPEIAEAIAHACARVAERPASPIGEEQHVLSRFTWDAGAQELLRVLDLIDR